PHYPQIRRCEWSRGHAAADWPDVSGRADRHIVVVRIPVAAIARVVLVIAEDEPGEAGPPPIHIGRHYRPVAIDPRLPHAIGTIRVPLHVDFVDVEDAVPRRSTLRAEPARRPVDIARNGIELCRAKPVRALEPDRMLRRTPV